MHVQDDIEGWLKFFLTGVAETATQALQTAQAIVALKERDTQRIMTLKKSSKNANKLLDCLYRTPLVRIKDIESISGLKNPNALVLAQKMENLGILKEITGQKRNRVYQYDAYISLFDSKQPYAF
jgi:Fic family protein